MLSMKILVVADDRVTPEHFRLALEPLQKDHYIQIIELDQTQKWKSNEGLRGYAGSPAQILERIEDYDILLVHLAPVPKSVIDRGKKLKLIGVARGGVVNVNVKAATERKIPVINAPGRNSIAVAELTIAFMICLARKIVSCAIRVKENKLIKQRKYYEGIELYGKTLGIIGLGRVGREVAKRALALGMKVIAYDPYVRKQDAERLGVKMVDKIEDIMSKADFVSLHAALTPRTRGMINKRLIDLMKPTAFFINTARAEIVDQEALYQALKEGRIAGAALDLIELFGYYPQTIVDFYEAYSRTEIPEDFITKLDNVIVTPHIGGQTREAWLRSVEILTKDIIRFLRGERPLNVVNPEVFIK